MDYSRTGIKERRILKEEGKGTSFLAIKAAEDLNQKKGIDPKDIDLVIVATATPDMKAASTAAYTATQIGATNAFSFDLEAACSSFCLECLQQQHILNLDDTKKSS